MSLISLNIMDESGHRTVNFEAATEKGGQALETEVNDLLQKGHTVLVQFPDDLTSYPVAGYDASNNAWIMRSGQSHQTLPAAQSSATALKPIVGG